MPSPSKPHVTWPADGSPCQKCGGVHPNGCKGHRRDKSGCTKYPAEGQDICYYHGARAPQNLAAAERRIAKREAAETVGELLARAELVIDSMTGDEQVLWGIRHAGAMAQGFRDVLDELPVESDWSFTELEGGHGTQATRWVNVTEAGLIGPDHHGQMKLHAYEEGYRFWVKLHADLLKKAHDMGLEERRLALAEREVSHIADGVRGFVEGLGHELDDPKVVPVVEAFLRHVAGAA